MLDSTLRKLTTHQKAVLVQVLRTFPDDALRIYGIEIQAECSGSVCGTAGSFLLRVGCV